MRGAPGRAKRAANSTTVPTKPSRMAAKTKSLPVQFTSWVICIASAGSMSKAMKAAPAGNPPAVQKRIAVA